MTDIQVLSICCSMIFLGCCIVYVSAKKITEMLYLRSNPEYTTKSPYGIARALTSQNKWGYAITKNGEFLKYDTTYPVWGEARHAIYEINILEKLEGYPITKL